MGMRFFKASVLAAALSALLAAHGLGAESTDGPADLPTAQRRVLQVFDFTEPQNHESVPMYWRKVEGRGFPHYAVGAFDHKVGHDSAPSFYLNANGGNVGYRYYARGIAAKEGSDYQVQAWIKPHRLNDARAYVSAYFMNRFGERIEGTERVSRPVGGPGSDGGWQAVKFILPGDVEGADLIALALYVVQSDVWRQSPVGPRSIFTPDIEGAAWFDDLTVLRLPRIRLECKASGSVFAHGEQPTVVAEVHDSDGKGLETKLVIRDAEGVERWCRDLPVCMPGDPLPRPFIFPNLAPGIYTATLQIRADGAPVWAPYLRFAKLGPDLRARRGVHRGFGMLVDNEVEALWPEVTRLTDLLGIRQVKVSLWADGRPAWQMARDQAGRSSYLAHLYRKDGMAVGTLGGVPRELQDPNLPYDRTLLDLFDESPGNLGSFLKYALARYAPFVNYWQIGLDGDRDLIWDRRLGGTIEQLNQSFRELISTPLLVAPWSVQQVMSGGRIPSAAISLFVSKRVPADQVGAHYASFRSLPFEERWLTVEALDPRQYAREPALGDFVKRMVSAKATGADIVFTEQPWTTRRVMGRAVIEPDERFMLLRTLVSLLSNSTPIIPLRFGEHTRGYLFDRRGEGVLVLWNDRAPPEGIRLVMRLGGAPQRISAWGEVSALPREDRRQVMRITQVPSFYEGVSTRLMMLRGALRLEPEFIESSLTQHEVVLHVTNPYREPVTGRIRLDVPTRWDLTPIRFEFSLSPGETLGKLLTLRYPQVETAGRKIIVANLTLDAAQQYELQVPLELELGLDDLGVTALAQRTGGKVVVRQRVTNYSSEPVNYRSYIVAPGRLRQTRLISNLRPGQTVVKQYNFEQAENLSGRRMRMGLREADGPRLYNQIIEVP